MPLLVSLLIPFQTTLTHSLIMLYGTPMAYTYQYVMNLHAWILIRALSFQNRSLLEQSSVLLRR